MNPCAGWGGELGLAQPVSGAHSSDQCEYGDDKIPSQGEWIGPSSKGGEWGNTIARGRGENKSGRQTLQTKSCFHIISGRGLMDRRMPVPSGASSVVGGHVGPHSDTHLMGEQLAPSVSSTTWQHLSPFCIFPSTQ